MQANQFLATRIAECVARERDRTHFLYLSPSPHRRIGPAEAAVSVLAALDDNALRIVLRSFP